MQVETVGCIIVCHLRTVHPLRIIICPCINPRTFECLDSGAASVCLVHPVKLGTAVLRIRSCCKKSAVFIKSHCKYFSACLEEFFSLSGRQVDLCEITVLSVWWKCQSVHDAFLIIKCHTDNLLVISQAVISKCHIIRRVVCCNAVKHTGIVISIEAAVIILSGPQRISTDHTCCDLGGFYIVVVDLHPVVIVLACIIIRTQKRFHLSCRRIDIYFQSIRKRSCYRFSILTFFITDRNAHRCLSFSYKMHLAKTVHLYHIFIAAVVNFGIRCRPDRRGHTFELHTATGKCRQRIGVGDPDIFYLNISGFRFVSRYRKQNGLLRTCFCRKISNLNALCRLASFFSIQAYHVKWRSVFCHTWIPVNIIGIIIIRHGCIIPGIAANRTDFPAVHRIRINRIEISIHIRTYNCTIPRYTHSWHDRRLQISVKSSDRINGTTVHIDDTQTAICQIHTIKSSCRIVKAEVSDLNIRRPGNKLCRSDLCRTFSGGIYFASVQGCSFVSHRTFLPFFHCYCIDITLIISASLPERITFDLRYICKVFIRIFNPGHAIGCIFIIHCYITINRIGCFYHFNFHRSLYRSSADHSRRPDCCSSSGNSRYLSICTYRCDILIV